MIIPHTAATITVWLAIAASSISAQPVSAQSVPAPRTPTQPPSRFDTAAFVGWYNGHQPQLNDSQSWYNRSIYGGANLGFYWTDHLKTEVEFGATSEDDLYSFETFSIGGREEFAAIEHTFGTKNLSLGHHYQFFENAWFHPAVGGGLAVTWERETIVVPPFVRFDPRAPGRPPTVPETIGPETHSHIDLFAATGFKAYVSERAFFRSDLKVVFGSQLRDVLARIGFGIDF